jgi:hypothetical protein
MLNNINKSRNAKESNKTRHIDFDGHVFATVGRNHIFFSCILTKLSLWYLLFENFRDNYDQKKWFVFVPQLHFRNKEYLWNGLMNFSSRDKKKKNLKKSEKFIRSYFTSAIINDANLALICIYLVEFLRV